MFHENFGDPVADDWTEEGVKDEQNLLSAFFANELTLALTLVFMIPQLRSKALSNEASSIDVFISLLFFGLILGIFAGINRDHYYHRAVLSTANLVLFVALGFFAPNGVLRQGRQFVGAGVAQGIENIYSYFMIINGQVPV